MDVCLRPATETDLPGIFRTRMATEGETMSDGHPVPVGFSHVLNTGRFVLAERGGRVVGFGASFIRDGVTFLSQLFVHPREQSGGIGQALLDAVLPSDGTVRSTIASPDARAVSLYVRHGMIPAWPVFDLSGKRNALHDLPESMVQAMPAEAGDPDLLTMDAATGGRLRPEEHRHWRERCGGLPYWFERNGRRVGYGYLQVARDGYDAALRGDSVRIGPIGVEDSSYAIDCVVAAVELARQHASVMNILLPGLHLSLGVLLEAGFRIGDIETFLCSVQPPFADGRRYVPSGGGMF